MSRTFPPNNAREIVSGYTPERGSQAQELINMLWSNDRVAAHIGVSFNAIVRWKRQGLLQTPSLPQSASKNVYLVNRDKMRVAQAMLTQGASTIEIIEKINVARSTFNRWKRHGVIK